MPTYRPNNDMRNDAKDKRDRDAKFLLENPKNGMHIRTIYGDSVPVSGQELVDFVEQIKEGLR